MKVFDGRQLVVGADAAVPVTTGQRPYINLDNAASTPALTAALDVVDSFVPWYASVHRGNGFKSRLSTTVFEEARAIVSRFVGADPREHVVIFGKNSTEAINKLSYRLRLHKTDVVLVSQLEHHSNDLPWRARATEVRIGLTKDGGIDQAHFSRLLERYGKRVKLVALSGGSNVTGHLPDIHWFARQAHAAGAEIFVDCAQLGAHRPIHMLHLDDPEHLDYIALSAHKMYAPFGTGALVGRRDTFTFGEPEYRGGGTVELVTTRGVDWADPPESEEAGSPNVIGALAMARAMQTLERISFPVIQKHEAALTARALTGMQAVPGLQLYGDVSPRNATQRLGVIPFTMANVPPHLVAAILGYEWGIGVRSGCFCAHPYVFELLGYGRAAQGGVRSDVLHRHRSRLPGMVRVSFGLYNTPAEIDTLITALQYIAAGKHHTYHQDELGEFAPADWRDDYRPYFSL